MPLFAATVFLSTFLLFQIQPMLLHIALPLVTNDGEPLAPKPGFRPWTDAFSNLFSVLK
jgi:hypothetical protein